MTAEQLANLNEVSQRNWKDATDIIRRTIRQDRAKWLDRMRTATPADLRAASDAELQLVIKLAGLTLGEALFRVLQEEAERT